MNDKHLFCVALRAAGAQKSSICERVGRDFRLWGTLYQGMTRLELFMRSRKIEAAALSRETNIARQHLLRIRPGKVEPRRKLIAAIVSGLRRMTLEPIQAEDVFELTVEESGEWRKTRGALLDERSSKDEKATTWVQAHCQGTTPEAWEVHLRNEPGLSSESLVRVLVLAARTVIDDSPERAAALSRFALDVIARIQEASAFLIQLRGCAGVQYANALLHLGRYAEALSVLEPAEGDLSAHVTSANDLAQAWYVRAKVLWKRGDFDDATQDARRAAVVLELLGDPRRLAFTHILEASIAFERGDPARARDLLRHVFAPLKRSGDKRALASAALSLGTAEGQLGNIREATRWIGSAAMAFERMRVKPELIRARWSLGYYTGLHGSRKEGIDLMRAAQNAFQELRMPLEAAFVSIDLAEVLLLVPGSAREVEQACRSAYELFSKAGVRPAAEEALAYLRAAATERRASQLLVKSVRTYLHILDRNPAARFRPNEAGAS